MNQEPFYSINQYNRKVYGEKVYKISLNGGMTCPNRDGTLGTKGCIFCSKGGSGDFAASAVLSISEQIEEAIERISRKYTGNSYIAYFQAFTNTYAPISHLEKIFTEAEGSSPRYKVLTRVEFKTSGPYGAVIVTQFSHPDSPTSDLHPTYTQLGARAVQLTAVGAADTCYRWAGLAVARKPECSAPQFPVSDVHACCSPAEGNLSSCTTSAGLP